MTGEIEVTGAAQADAWRLGVRPPVEAVRPGLWSIPVPIPHSPLRYTLSYAYVEDAGVVVVDPGWDTPEGRDAVRAGLAVAGAGLPDVTGIVVTHVHPDHHGLSGWLRAQSGAWIGMHPAEVGTLPARMQQERPPGADREWLRRHGVPEADIDGLAADPARIRGLLEMAEPDRLIEDGDRLRAGTREVRAVWTPGHTPGHLCLHDPDAGVLLTGDHLLPRISPNIGAHGENDDPLTAYLRSLDRTRDFAADEALPAHEYRFRGIDRRAKGLAEHHAERCAEIRRVAAGLSEATAWAIAERLSWSRGWASLQGLMRRLALAETVAHLRHLATAGELRASATYPTTWHPGPR